MTMRVTKMIMMETGTYNDMTFRPYKAHFDGETCAEFNALAERGLNFTAPALAGLAGRVVQPQAIPAGIIPIENSWSNTRLRFMMEVEIDGVNNTVLREILCGYTDYPGASRSGNVDPNLKLYFNTSVTIRAHREQFAFGTGIRAAVADASHVLYKDPNESFTTTTNNLNYVMRPEDVVGAISTQQFNGENFYERRSTMMNGVKKSRRANGLAPEYMAKIITSLNSAYTDPEATVKSSMDLYENARDQLREPTIQNDLFLKFLSQQTEFGRLGYVTYGHLEALFPQLDSMAFIFMRGQTRQTREAWRGDSENWTGSTIETTIATTLSHSIPSLMMDHMLCRIGFKATNRTHDGSIDVQPHSPASWTDGIDLWPWIEKFIARFKMEVLRDISNNGLVDFEILGFVEVTGDTFLEISIGGQPPVHFTTPSFCDSLMAPVVARGSQNLNELAMAMDTMFNGARTTNGFDYDVPGISMSPGISGGFNNNQSGEGYVAIDSVI